MSSEQNPECCPKFDPVPWENQMHEWDNKRFVKDHVNTIFHAPTNFGTVVQRIMAKMDAVGAQSPGWLGLSEHTSKWNMDLYVASDKEVPEIENVLLTGKFFSKVYDGGFNDTGKWFKNFESDAKSRGLKVDRLFIWYTTCPKCAKKYGNNYVVIIGQVTNA